MRSCDDSAGSVGAGGKPPRRRAGQKGPRVAWKVKSMTAAAWTSGHEFFLSALPPSEVRLDGWRKASIYRHGGRGQKGSCQARPRAQPVSPVRVAHDLLAGRLLRPIAGEVGHMVRFWLEEVDLAPGRPCSAVQAGAGPPRSPHRSGASHQRIWQSPPECPGCPRQ